MTMIGGYDASTMDSESLLTCVFDNETMSSTVSPTWKKYGHFPFVKSRYASCQHNLEFIVSGAMSKIPKGMHYSSAGRNPPLNTVHSFDVETGDWSPLPSLPNGRYLHSQVSLNGYLYVIGGETVVTTSFGTQTFLLSSVIRLNKQETRWDTMASLPRPLRLTSALAMNNKIFVFGGESNEFTHERSVFCYDPQLNTWETMRKMPKGLREHSVTHLNNEIYVTGGMTMGTSVQHHPTGVSKAVYLFTSPSQTSPISSYEWIELPSLERPRVGHVSLIWNKKLVVVGGYTVEIDGPLDVHQRLVLFPESYNIIDQTWTTSNELAGQITRSHFGLLISQTSVDVNIFTHMIEEEIERSINQRRQREIENRPREVIVVD